MASRPGSRRARLLVVAPRSVVPRLVARLAAAGHAPVGASTDGEATRLMDAAPDALVLDGGVSLARRTALAARFTARFPGRPVVEHTGGPSALAQAVGRAVRG
ncbi:MAG: hypothetical protein AB7O28_25440 [Vicinamibacterales bacterium]